MCFIHSFELRIRREVVVAGKDGAVILGGCLNIADI